MNVHLLKYLMKKIFFSFSDDYYELGFNSVRKTLYDQNESFELKYHNFCNKTCSQFVIVS